MKTEDTMKDSFVPVWDDDETLIHPALDFVDNKVWLSQFLNYINMGNKKKILTLITSDREKFIIHNDDVISELGFDFKYMPNKIDNRWSKESIKAFLDGNNKEVDIKDLFNEIKYEIEKYIDLPDKKMYDFLACWIIGTYLHPMFNTYPYVYLNAIKRAGKTKLLTLLSCLCFNAKMSLSMTPATMFRLIQGNKCTLLIDETENLKSKDHNDFRSMLLSGYKKGMKVPRAQEMKGRKAFEVNEYEVFAPKVLANISGIEDVLEDRCITLVLLRTNNYTIGNREINLSDTTWDTIRDKLYINLLCNYKDIERAYTLLSDNFIGNSDVSVVSGVDVGVNTYKDKNIKNLYIETATSYAQTTLRTLKNRIKNIKNRELELWLPIMSIGLTVSDEVFNNIIDLCLDIVKAKETEDMAESTDLVLIEVLADIVDKDDWYPVKKITSRLRGHLGFDEKEALWLNNRHVGRALKRLRFNEKRRVSTGIEYRLNYEKIKDLSERAGMSLDKFIKKDKQENLDTTKNI